MAAMVMMVRLGRLAAWVVIVLLAREFIVSGLRTIAAGEGIVIAAGQEGKWKTSIQLCGIIALCVHYVHPLDLIWWKFYVDYNRIGQVLMYISMVLSLWSAGVYFKAFLSMLARRSTPAYAARGLTYFCGCSLASICSTSFLATPRWFFLGASSFSILPSGANTSSFCCLPF